MNGRILMYIVTQCYGSVGASVGLVPTPVDCGNAFRYAAS
jgi:hypothetical protein